MGRSVLCIFPFAFSIFKLIANPSLQLQEVYSAKSCTGFGFCVPRRIFKKNIEGLQRRGQRSHGHRVSWGGDMRRSWSAKGRQDLCFPAKQQQLNASRQTGSQPTSLGRQFQASMARARWVAGCRRHHVDQMMDLCSVSVDGEWGPDRYSCLSPKQH